MLTVCPTCRNRFLQPNHFQEPSEQDGWKEGKEEDVKKKISDTVHPPTATCYVGGLLVPREYSSGDSCLNAPTIIHGTTVVQSSMTHCDSDIGIIGSDETIKLSCDSQSSTKQDDCSLLKSLEDQVDNQTSLIMAVKNVACETSSEQHIVTTCKLTGGSVTITKPDVQWNNGLIHSTENEIRIQPPHIEIRSKFTGGGCLVEKSLSEIEQLLTSKYTENSTLIDDNAHQMLIAPPSGCSELPGNKWIFSSRTTRENIEITSPELKQSQQTPNTIETNKCCDCCCMVQQKLCQCYQRSPGASLLDNHDSLLLKPVGSGVQIQLNTTVQLPANFGQCRVNITATAAPCNQVTKPTTKPRTRNNFNGGGIVQPEETDCTTRNRIITIKDNNNKEWKNEAPITPMSWLMPCPWNLGTELLNKDVNRLREVRRGKTTFIVRSNLVLQDQQLNQTLNSSKKNSEGHRVSNGNSEEKNTDIIEAVQLRRVHSTPAIYDVKDNLERCLDIRIESKEFAKLKHMQVELSNFIQREIKQKVSSVNNKTDKNITMTDSVTDTNLQSKLDRNLKKLIQTAIERNIEHWIDNGNDAGHQRLQRVSPKLVKAVAHLSQYQPKVVLERLDLSKHVNNDINIQNTLKRVAPRNESPCKRLVVPPKKYDDFNTSFNSELNDSENLTSKSRAVCSRTYKNSTTKKLHSKVAIEKQINNSIVTANKDNSAMSSLAKENLTDRQKILTSAKFYICSICKSTFKNQMDIQTHILTSHTMTNTSRVSVMSTNNNTVTMPQPKQKKMRCKKCYEIVEYQSIKTHISTCKMTTQVYVCHVCDSNFNAKKLLFQHMETIHNMSQMTNTLEIKETNDTDEWLESRVEAATSTTSQESQTVGLQLPTVSEALQKGLAIQTNKEGICVMPLKKHTNETNVQSTTMDVSNIQSDKITATNVKSNAAKNVRKDQEYTCFLCDKVFTDEEMLKDHLQQHCDDLSDEEQNDNTHKCTICGNLLDSYKALEEHICKHWFDGEGSNDLNSVSLNDGNTTEDSSTEDEIHQCSECWEMFDSQSLLDMHTRVHVQEVPMVEPEEQVEYQYLCMLCDDLLDTEKDLADHINLHNGDAQICQLCDKPFHTLEELQEHVTTHL